MLDISATKPLTKAEIKAKASSVYQDKSAPHTSEKYVNIPTYKLIDDMAELGWGCVEAKQVKSKKGEGYQKHLLVFRNPDVVIEGLNGDNVFPQILLTNSHDGKCGFTFTAGLFRLVCENGLVISTQEFEKISIRHMGYSFSVVEETVKSIINKLPLTVDSMNKLMLVEMEEEQILEFATNALATRFKPEDLERINIDVRELVTPNRPEDVGNNLWRVFNVVQEKIINGEFNYTVGVKHRKARKIKNFQQDMVVNAKLFDLALEYVN